MRLTEGHEGHAWWKEPGHSYIGQFVLIGNFRHRLARELLVLRNICRMPWLVRRVLW